MYGYVVVATNKALYRTTDRVGDGKVKIRILTSFPTVDARLRQWSVKYYVLLKK